MGCFLTQRNVYSTLIKMTMYKTFVRKHGGGNVMLWGGFLLYREMVAGCSQRKMDATKYGVNTEEHI